MKKILFSLLVLLSGYNSMILNAQNSTWLNGVNANDDVGVYGTQGVEAPTNKPGSRREFVTWKDNNGNLWLFGGFGRAASSITGLLSDLWKYNPTNNQWTWMSGPNTRNQQAIYGTQNVAATTNRPGSRRWSTGWADGSGNLWLFGGFGYAATAVTGRLNDLWKYNTATNEWTWVSGANVTSQTGDYTTVGALRPGARQKACSWFDGTNGWVFSGDGFPSTATAGTLNDLWRYNTSTNTWSFMSGDDAISAAAVYGTLGVANAANKPGAREYAMSWYDAGKLYMFGGGAGTVSYYNDLWTYDIATNLWTWIKGNNTINNTGVYGTYWGIDPANTPGGRQLSAVMKDAQNRVFLFGGQGYGSAGSGILNDIWCYRPLDNTWTWVGGSSTPDAVGVYGVQGTYAAANKIGARYGAGGWTDAAGNIILFGGFGNATTTSSGYLSDLWSYNAAAVLPITLVSFQAKREGSDVVLNWVTTDEKNNAYFTILHSLDGSNFEELGTVNSKAINSSEKLSYDFKHVGPDMNLVHFYQLKQTDIDGKTSQSDIIRIEKNKSADLNATVWTNANQQVMVSTSASNGFTTKVFNCQGQCIFSGKQAGSLASIPANNWPSGFYFVQVSAGAQLTTVKIVLP